MAAHNILTDFKKLRHSYQDYPSIQNMKVSSWAFNFQNPKLTLAP